MRTIVKWSKSAVILAVAAVLLAAFVFVKTAHADSINEAQQAVVKSQQEASKTKAQLEAITEEKTKLNTEVQVRDEKIQQLEKENAELKG